MNTTKFPPWAGIAVLVAMVANSYGEEPPMRDVTTHEQLVSKLRQAQQIDPMKYMPAVTGGDPSKVYQPKDILSESDIIAFQRVATLVPKRAILLIPKNYQDRIAMQPGAKIVGWADFYAANRGWITTVEVSRTQAEGNLALPDDTQKHLSECGNLVVATYMGGPISMLPHKEPKTPDPKTPTATDPKAPKTTGSKTTVTTQPAKP